MMLHPLRSTAELRLVPEREVVPEPKVAVLLNANARKVSERVIRSLSHVVPEGDLYVSRSQADCRRIATTVVDRRYHTVFTGGGDGTFVGFVNEIQRQLELRSRYFPQRAPRFGVLKLGTGNGLASLVNASSLRGEGFLDDVLRARAGEVPGYRTLDLLEVDGKLSPFAGLGLDGKLLNDYIWVKENLGRGAMKRLLTGAGGYFSAVAFRTVPHYLTTSTRVECEVFNGPDAVAYRLNPDGSTASEVEPGGLLFRGRLMMCAAGTIPFYGFSFRMFPFAGQRRGFMNLRLGAVGTVEALANLHHLWKGRWFPEGRVHDVHARSFTARFARPMPFQVGGDAEGYRDQISMRVGAEPVQLVDFRGSVN
jgi:diacylglycerol kinase family enzyme